jgi:hypothetical protein
MTQTRACVCALPLQAEEWQGNFSALPLQAEEWERNCNRRLRVDVDVDVLCYAMPCYAKTVML